jgi:hypothetical protein
VERGNACEHGLKVVVERGRGGAEVGEFAEDARGRGEVAAAGEVGA